MHAARGFDHHPPFMHQNAFDTIVVGAGAAGIVANRLSADPKRRVALIEAGASDRRFPLSVKTTLPIGNIFLLPSERYNWQFEFSGGAGVKHRKIPCPRGRLFGGCTSVNGTVYIRGHRLDYDEWAALGNNGWSWDEVLPFFKRHEDYDRGSNPWHGSGGELSVQRPAESNPLAHAFVDAAAEAGFARNDDFNAAAQDGFGIFDLNQRDGVRWSSDGSGEFEVESLEEFVARAVQSGSRVRIPPVDSPINRYAVLDDPWGNLYGFSSMFAGERMGPVLMRGPSDLEPKDYVEILLRGGSEASPRVGPVRLAQ